MTRLTDVELVAGLVRVNVGMYGLMSATVVICAAMFYMNAIETFPKFHYELSFLHQVF